MRIYIFLLALLTLAGCAVKPVETVYHEQEDVTRYTTKPFITETGGKEIELVAVKECSGKVICMDQDIKLTVKHAGRFSFLKGKDLLLETEQGSINLNERDYSKSYNVQSKAKDGTSGVLSEQFLIWVSEAEFRKAAHAEKASLDVGEHSFTLSTEGREPWQILLDAEKVLAIMGEEQQREYGLFPHDNKESLVENLPFIDKLASSGVQDVSVGYYMALPGTELFYSLYDSGKICLDINYFRHILDSLAILPSQSYTSSLGRLDLMLWKLRMFKRFYTANRIGLNKKPLLVRVLDLLSGLGKKKHETRLQTAIRNGLESALTTFIVKFKPAWLNSKQEELMFTNWDKIYRELRLKKISQLAAKPYPEDTTELHKTNVINLLKVEHNVKYKV